MSKLPGKDRVLLQREPHKQKCVACSRDGEKSSMSGVQRTVEVGVREAVLIG